MFPCTDQVEPVKPEVIKLGVVGEEKVTMLSNSHPDSFVECDDRGLSGDVVVNSDRICDL